VQRAVKVEAKFDGSTWVDISSKVKMAAGISVNRGRESEVEDPVAVGTVSLALDNSDGRFSPELASSPYYPNVVAGVPLRVSVYVSGAYRVRGYGTVQEWSTDPLSWYVAGCSINAADVLGTLPEYTFRQAADEAVRRSAGVLYHWPLREASEPLSSMAGVATLSTNGKDGLGLGAPLLAMEEGEGNHPQFISGSNGLQLVARYLSVGPPWRVRLVIMGQPTASCELLELELPGVASRTLITWDSVNGFGNGGGSLANPPSWPAVVEIGTDGSVWRLRVGGVAGSLATAYGGTRISKVTINPTLSGGSIWSAAHLVVLQGVSSAADLDAFAQQITSQRVTTFATAPEVVLGWAGGPTISGIPASVTTLPPLEGRDSADVLSGIAKSMGGRIVDDLDGTLTWLPFPPTGTVVTLPAGFTVPPYGTDDRAWLSDCTVEYPDGTSYTATRPDGPRRSDTIEAVHATPNGDRGMADWLVNSPTKARIASVTYNLSAMTDANVLTVLNLVVGSRVSFPTLPAWIPSGLICTVEGFQESIGNDAWTVTLNLSPDVYSRLFILDDAIRGVLDSAYLLAP